MEPRAFVHVELVAGHADVDGRGGVVAVLVLELEGEAGQDHGLTDGQLAGHRGRVQGEGHGGRRHHGVVEDLLVPLPGEGGEGGGEEGREEREGRRAYHLGVFPDAELELVVARLAVPVAVEVVVPDAHTEI
jgi:hypothetical protein